MSGRKKLIISLTIVFLFGLFVFKYARSNYAVPILMYHSVNTVAPEENRLVVSRDSFERQMRFLKTRRYNVVPLGEIGQLIRHKKKIPPKTIAITFDDGYKDNYTYAFPILKKYNLPATIFVIINEVGRPQNDRLSWDEIKQMQSCGIITIGSHCLGPEPLVNIKSDASLKKEIFDSKKILEDRLKTKVDIFCYPGGQFNDKIKQMVVDAGYKMAVVTNPGRRFPNDDILALKRLRISSTSDSLFVFWVESSGYYNMMRERRHK